MDVYTTILGNCQTDLSWKDKIQGMEVERIYLDQWTAQKSRFVGKGDHGNEYAIALPRHTQIHDGDLIYYSEADNVVAVLKLELSPVLVINMDGLEKDDPNVLIRTALELGHAIGNQHWPAVVKGTKIYVPLTVDKTVMKSVLETHHIEGITFDFEPGVNIIPFLLPHEIRRLFGGTEHHSHSFDEEHGHAHTHTHLHEEEHSHYSPLNNGDLNQNHHHHHS